MLFSTLSSLVDRERLRMLFHSLSSTYIVSHFCRLSRYQLQSTCFRPRPRLFRGLSNKLNA